MIADPTDHHRRPIGRARLRPPGAMAPVDAILSAPFKYGMLDLGLQSVIRGKPVRTTISDKAAPCPLDQVNRQFHAPAPNVLWVSGFAYVATWAGFVYVAFVIDVYARYIVS
jgi:hypothetical protein